MSAYKEFNDTDVIHYILSTSPEVVAVSGSNGWRSSTGASGSLSLYGGFRAKVLSGDELNVNPIFDLNTYTIDGALKVTASYPFTGTLSYAKCVNRFIDLNDDYDAQNWGQERYSSILNLYDYYQKVNVDYTTGSYDYYMLYYEPGTTNKVVYSGSLYTNITSSYSIEAVIKPLSISGSDNDYTIISRNDLWSFYITGSDGRLAFSASDGYGSILTSSFSVTRDRWQHVSYVKDSGTGSFKINMVDAGTYDGITGSLDSGSISEAINVGFNNSLIGNGFHGFIFDIKAWSNVRTFSQLSSSFDRTLIDSSSLDLKLYSRFNDGPLSQLHGFSKGSGAFDYSTNANHGELINFNTRMAPIWHPNDNKDYIVPKNLITGSYDEIKVIHVPSMFYGRQIATGSVIMVCNAFLSSSLQRVLVDDGRGGLYLSGSASSASLDTKENYDGVKWNKVGNVFYSEGLIIIRDPAMLDFAQTNTNTQLTDDILQVSFKGQNTIPTKVFNCRVNGAEFNASNNPTYVKYNSTTGNNEIVRGNPTTYITTVGLYNEERKLVAVAKLASPIRNRERDSGINIRLKMDF